jgi:hypothetical protein
MSIPGANTGKYVPANSMPIPIVGMTVSPMLSAREESCVSKIKQADPTIIRIHANHSWILYVPDFLTETPARMPEMGSTRAMLKHQTPL